MTVVLIGSTAESFKRHLQNLLVGSFSLVCRFGFFKKFLVFLVFCSFLRFKYFG